MNKEKWYEICFLLSENIKLDISESNFEQSVIQALRILDWKEYLGDLQIRPSFPVGASNRIMPDFVIGSSGTKNLFVIEIKQPSIPINAKFQQQLFSYMRLLKLQYGLLIGESIQIFYDGDLTENDDPVLLETIEFKKENSKGIKFVELFSKENFSYENLKSYTLNSIKRINRREEQKILEQKILSPDFESEVLELIKESLLQQYDGELIETILQKISINITAKNHIKGNKSDFISDSVKLEKSSSRDTTKYKLNGSGKTLGKNRFVLEVVKKFLEQNPTDYSSLKTIFRDELQGSTGVINKLDFVETKYANKTNKRHFTSKDEILVSSDNIKFVVTTEWGKGNIDNIVNLARKYGFKVEEI